MKNFWLLEDEYTHSEWYIRLPNELSSLVINLINGSQKTDKNTVGIKTILKNKTINIYNGLKKYFQKFFSFNSSKHK